MSRPRRQVRQRLIGTNPNLQRGIETLEDRTAPGCMLDLFGLTVAAHCSDVASSIESPSSQSSVRSDSARMARIQPHEEDSPAARSLTTGTAFDFAAVPNGEDPQLFGGNRSDEPGNRESSFPGHVVRPGLVSARTGLLPQRAMKLGSDHDFVSSTSPAPDRHRDNSASFATNAAFITNAAFATNSTGTKRSSFTMNAATTSTDSTRGSILSVGVDAAAKTDEEDSRVPRGLPYANPSDPLLPMDPYAVVYDGSESVPTTGVVKSPAEYDPMRGVLFSYRNYTGIVADMVKELTEDPSKDEIAYVVVSSTAQQVSATTTFTNAGADMSKVQFFVQPSDSVWIRDYGPHFVTVDESLAIVDSHYYPNRPLDNFIPTLLGDNNFNVPTYDMGLYFSGGNFQAGPNESAFVTSLVNYHNTATDGFHPNFISELYYTYQGIETLHVLPQLPFSVDATGHLDMWMYLVDEDTVVISEFAAGSNSSAIQITNNAVGYMESLGFNVYRTPAWNVGSTHYTYANAFRVNDRIFVPVYGTMFKPGGNPAYNDRDAAAMATWQAAAGPDVEIIPIQSNAIIPAAGAIHCIVKQVPRYTGTAPAANVISPAGGEVLLVGSQHKIEWSAIDTDNRDPAEIRISISYGGPMYHPIATTTDTGSYLWTVNGRADQATIKIVARSADNDEVQVFSRPFSIARGTITTYDFSSGAGVDKFAFGSQTNAWSNIQGNLFAVATPLTAGNYAALATSNATGGDADSNRYIAPVPSPVSAESTHIFEFQLAGETSGSLRMAEIDVLWEGYADYCTQVEMYVWDLLAQNWGDATGRSGNNRYLDSWAGNADGFLSGSIRSDFSRYVDRSGTIRFLVYSDRTGTNPDTQHNTGQGIETFHDYMSVTVKHVQSFLPDLLT